MLLRVFLSLVLVVPLACSTSRLYPEDYFADATPITPAYDKALQRLKGRVVIDKTRQLFQEPMMVLGVYSDGHYFGPRGLRRISFAHPEELEVFGKPSRSGGFHSLRFLDLMVGSDGDIFDLLTRVSPVDVGSLEPGRLTKDYKSQLGDAAK